METPNQTVVEEPAAEPQLVLPPVIPRGYELTGEYAKGVLQMRDLRVKDKYDRQMKLYSPCSCGSGKKHKFCCNGKEMVVINTGV